MICSSRDHGSHELQVKSVLYFFLGKRGRWRGFCFCVFTGQFCRKLPPLGRIFFFFFVCYHHHYHYHRWTACDIVIIILFILIIIINGFLDIVAVSLSKLFQCCAQLTLLQSVCLSYPSVVQSYTVFFEEAGICTLFILDCWTTTCCYYCHYTGSHLNSDKYQYQYLVQTSSTVETGCLSKHQLSNNPCNNLSIICIYMI